MNLQLTNTITGITGQTGLAIIRAVVAGERNPQELTKLRNYRIHASEADAKLDALITPLLRQGVKAAEGKVKRGGKNALGFDVRNALREWAGVDLTKIGGIDVCTVLKVLVELGPDLSTFKLCLIHFIMTPDIHQNNLLFGNDHFQSYPIT